jgi:hypothetical protein
MGGEIKETEIFSSENNKDLEDQNAKLSSDIDITQKTIDIKKKEIKKIKTQKIAKKI